MLTTLDEINLSHVTEVIALSPILQCWTRTEKLGRYRVAIFGNKFNIAERSHNNHPTTSAYVLLHCTDLKTWHNR